MPHGVLRVISLRGELQSLQLHIMNIILFIHSTLDGHLTCFQLETIINNVATNLFSCFLALTYAGSFRMYT